MGKGKEVCLVYSREFDGEFYVRVEDFKEIMERVINQRAENGKLVKENKKLKEDCKVVGILNDEIRRVNKNLREENKKLREENEFFMKQWKGLQSTLNRLEEENKKLRETIKDHQFYEEKLEHRIIEFEELLHGE